MSPDPKPPVRYKSCIRRVGDQKVTINYRPESVADRNIIRQVFVDGGYAMAQWPHGRALRQYYRNELSKLKPFIIDAGGNIGASALYFKAKFPRAFVYAIEPEESNADLFEYNMAGTKGYELFRGAVGGKSGSAFLKRGKRDAGHQVGEVGDTAVDVIDTPSIVAALAKRNMSPFIYKIDIEGGETNLFQGPTDWMSSFPCIILELHDWMIPFQRRAQPCLKAIAEHDFDVVHRGEHLFVFNNALLGHYRTHPDVMKGRPRGGPNKGKTSLLHRLRKILGR